ncbi:uncharacterized protein SCHCODRAFT_02618085 [Schizophyllum commune H4-8]|uniref:uncharacterized protein n=1 Tax=Schizophyllum commune (strain H4-8 / FGSC 9210) TaxID=578458 RepID=UPI00215E9F58|nr:uncharacterized protein SCHCODRAFT_02618085 [Schizophyllum commune H4-8]KAI5894918.1 hypothetical protein SCHCODRAFT_02618085 [Schizophyllum commune H4-8]
MHGEGFRPFPSVAFGLWGLPGASSCICMTEWTPAIQPRTSSSASFDAMHCYLHVDSISVDCECRPWL